MLGYVGRGNKSRRVVVVEGGKVGRAVGAGRFAIILSAALLPRLCHSPLLLSSATAAPAAAATAAANPRSPTAIPSRSSRSLGLLFLLLSQFFSRLFLLGCTEDRRCSPGLVATARPTTASLSHLCIVAMRKGFIIVIINIHRTATPYILRPAISYCCSGV